MNIEVVLIWPAIAFVFAVVFAGLWWMARASVHLLAFALGFFALFLLMTLVIVFSSITQSYLLAGFQGLSCFAVIAIIWGAARRLNQRVPLFAMGALSVLSCILLYFALELEEPLIALLVQNEASGLLFGIGAVVLWSVRSANLLDRMLVWILSLHAGFNLLRPIVLLYLEVEASVLIERKIEVSTGSVLFLTVLTLVMGMILVAIAIQEAIETWHGSKRTDPVTGFLDQKTFEVTCERVLARAQRLNMPVTIAVLQFDWFKSVMEKWGPNTSDMVIREISDVVRSWQRDSDMIGRVGEGQFAILFTGVGAQSSQKIINRLRNDVDEACNDRMSGLLKFTLSSSIWEARSGVSFVEMMRDALVPLAHAEKLGANVSFVNGVENQHFNINSPPDGTFVAHG